MTKYTKTVEPVAADENTNIKPQKAKVGPVTSEEAQAEIHAKGLDHEAEIAAALVVPPEYVGVGAIPVQNPDGSSQHIERTDDTKRNG